MLSLEPLVEVAIRDATLDLVFTYAGNISSPYFCIFQGEFLFFVDTKNRFGVIYITYV